MQTTFLKQSIVSSRVALLLRSAEIKLLFFDLSFLCCSEGNMVLLDFGHGIFGRHTKSQFSVNPIIAMKETSMELFWTWRILGSPASHKTQIQKVVRKILAYKTGAKALARYNEDGFACSKSYLKLGIRYPEVTRGHLFAASRPMWYDFCTESRCEMGLSATVSARSLCRL